MPVRDFVIHCCTVFKLLRDNSLLLPGSRSRLILRALPLPRGFSLPLAAAPDSLAPAAPPQQLALLPFNESMQV